MGPCRKLQRDDQSDDSRKKAEARMKAFSTDILRIKRKGGNVTGIGEHV